MKCPSCGALSSRVIDSRPSCNDTEVMRRRACIKCKHRWTTIEMSLADPAVTFAAPFAQLKAELIALIGRWKL